MKRFLTIVLFLMSALPCGVLAADLKVSSVLDVAEIVQGQETVLRVSVAGASRAKVTIPKVEGLEITYAGQSTSIQIVNLTQMENTVTYMYRVNGFKPGAYTIPQITVEAGGIVKQSQPLELNILKGSSDEPSAGGPGAAQEEKIKVEASQGDQPYFVQMDLKDERLYVGQMAPVTFRLFVRVGIDFTLKSLPMLNSEAFTIGTLAPKPEQYQVSISGVAYHMLIWNSVVTPVKSGDYTLEMTQSAEVMDRDRILGGASGLFDQLLARGTAKPVEMKGKPLKISVLPLPQENKPASFSGAIGSFTFVGQAAPLELNAGEPMELIVGIEGRGNFDRIDWPGMAQNRLWRSYPPTSSFKASESTGIEGKKSVKQALIPLSAEIKEIPMQEFSYFDPVVGQYKTLRTDPIPLKIRPTADSPNSTNQAALSAANGQLAQPGLNNATPDPLGLLPNRLTLGSSGQSTKAWWSESWFYMMLLVPLLLVIAALVLILIPLVNHHWGGEAKGRELDRVITREIQAMESALQQSDADTFSKKARRVLQLVLARQWNCPPESVTRHEVRERQPQGAEELEYLFSGLDAVEYSGANLSEEEMLRIHEHVHRWIRNQKGGSNV